MHIIPGEKNKSLAIAVYFFNIPDFPANFQPWLSWFCSFKITFSIIDKYIPAAGI